jgi:ATP-dependent DNA ligase
MDGMRFMAVVSKDGLFGTASCKIYSRNGNELDIGPIATSFAMFITKDHPTGVFDGELLVRDVNGNYLPRKEGNGILLKMQEGTATKEELNSVIAVVWDYITLEEFNSRKGIIPYSERLDRVRYFYDSIVPLGNISIIDTFEIKSQEDADFLFRQALVNKYEGIVVKTKDGLWKDGRANYQLKMKDFKSVELKVVDFQYSEDTKYAGGLGALVCEDFSGTVRVSVGSGFTDKERFTITPEYILDKIIEVKYSEIITSKKDKKKSLFLNSFMGIRHDKTIADSLE